MPGHLSRLPNWIGVSSAAFALASAASNAANVVGRASPELPQLRLVVVDADDLTRHRQAEQAAAAEALAVAGEAVHAQDSGRVARAPAVLLRVGVERQQQVRLHERAHRRVAVVRLDDVGRVRARSRQLQRRQEVGEGLRRALDLDVRVLLLELCVQLLDCLRLAAPHLLIPHVQGDRGGGRSRRGGRCGGAARRAAARDDECERRQ